MGRVKVPIGLPCPFWKCLRRFSTASPHYADNILPQADALAVQVMRGGPPVLALTADQF